MNQAFFRMKGSVKGSVLMSRFGTSLSPPQSLTALNSGQRDRGWKEGEREKKEKKRKIMVTELEAKS